LQISLAWDASTDDTGIREYRVSVSPNEGNLVWTGPTSATLVGLAPSTEYTFTVTAQDFGYNLSLAAQQRRFRDDDAEHGHDAADRADEPARVG
jgi:chitinase